MVASPTEFAEQHAVPVEEVQVFRPELLQAVGGGHRCELALAVVGGEGAILVEDQDVRFVQTDDDLAVVDADVDILGDALGLHVPEELDIVPVGATVGFGFQHCGAPGHDSISKGF